MIDHVSVRVRDLEASLRFYQAALAPLGYEVIMKFPQGAGLGVGGKPDLWLSIGGEGGDTHVAVRATLRSQVTAFHAAALAAGGKDNGAPGPRPHYHPNYFGAFVHDPDGHNLEVVCHEPYLG